MTDLFGDSYDLTPPSPSGIEVTEVDHPVVPDDGGLVFMVRGTFRLSPARVYVVTNGVSIPCYSGAPGHGYTPIPSSTSSISVVTPPLPRGGPWDVHVVQGVEEATGVGLMTVVARVWTSRVFDLRRLFPPWYRLGPRVVDSTVELLT